MQLWSCLSYIVNPLVVSYGFRNTIYLLSLTHKANFSCLIPSCKLCCHFPFLAPQALLSPAISNYLLQFPCFVPPRIHMCWSLLDMLFFFFHFADFYESFYIHFKHHRTLSVTHHFRKLSSLSPYHAELTCHSIDHT